VLALISQPPSEVWNNRRSDAEARYGITQFVDEVEIKSRCHRYGPLAVDPEFSGLRETRTAQTANARAF
jgi:hypothetical protein